MRFCGLLLAGLLSLAPRLVGASESGKPRDPPGERGAPGAMERGAETASGGGKINSPGVRRAIVICGHPGGEKYRAIYAESVEKICGALVKRYGFESDNVWVWFGGEPNEHDGPAVSHALGLSTRGAIAAGAAKLGKVIRAKDALWVIVFGHAYFDGRHSFLNLPGPDMREDEFGGLFKGIQSFEQVFFIATPASGYFIKNLSAKQRIIITATEADLEINETLFHLDLAEVLSDPPEQDRFDCDQDGAVTVLDLYLTVVRRLMLRYAADESIPTEHAQLDDNGDGRGTEVQVDYLAPNLGGRAGAGVRRRIGPSADGALAASVPLGLEPPQAGSPMERKSGLRHRDLDEATNSGKTTEPIDRTKPSETAPRP